jgi:hypothetical protein
VNVMTLIRLTLTWLPEVVKAASLVEALSAPGTPGPQKKALVMAYLSQVATKLNKPWGPDALTTISSLIDSAVAIMNLVGRFLHSKDASPGSGASTVVDAPAVATAMANVAKVAERDEVLEEFLLATERRAATD